MSAWVISLLFTIGATTWVWSKMMRRTGNNTQQVLVITVVAAVVIFIVSFSIVSLIA